MRDNKNHIVLTGGTGFVGSAIIKRLAATDEIALVACARNPANLPVLPGVQIVPIATMAAHTDWGAAVAKAQVVIHSAARAHIMNDQAANPLMEFRSVNVEGTLNLARQAARAGVKRFIFLSSIKVNGESTSPNRPYTAADKPAPVDPYGISKMEAEEGLRALAAETGLEVVIIRPVLVYGPGVKANFRTMMNWLVRGVPLPLGAVHNRRSLVALDNLVDLIVTCIDHPAAANETFLVSDGEDLSTTDLLRRLGLALDRPARLVPVPTSLLIAGATVLGKSAVARRLCESLQVDITKTQEQLRWVPPVSVDDALSDTARDFLRRT